MATITAILTLLTLFAPIIVSIIQNARAKAADPVQQDLKRNQNADQIISQGAKGVTDLNLALDDFERELRPPGSSDPG